jgi:hypothetical protein
MAGVERQRIRGTSARRCLSGRTFGAAFDLGLLTYGVLPTPCLIVGVDFAGVSRLPILILWAGIGPEPSTAQVGPLGLGEGVFWPSLDRQRRDRWAGRCLVEDSLAQTGWDSEVKIVRL